MRLTRLPLKGEVRRTDESKTQGNRQAKPARSRKHGRNRGAWDGWRRNVQKCRFSNQGNLSWTLTREARRHGRSQSVRSSEEASNDPGAKGHRKLVGAMTVEGHNQSSIVPKRLSVLEPKSCRKPGCSQRGRGHANATQVVWPGWGSQASATSGSAHFIGPATGKPDTGNPPVRFGGRGEDSNPRPYPYRRSRSPNLELCDYKAGGKIEPPCA
jgi:hypothetical protein